VQLQATFVESAWEKEKEPLTSILFTVQKTYEDKFPKLAKMTKNTLKSPKIYRKITEN
jgi:hypothetical protein